MEKSREFAEHAAKIVKEALEADPEAVSALFESRVNCNEKLAQHPTIQVQSFPDPKAKEGKACIGALGLLNGILWDTGFVIMAKVEEDEATKKLKYSEVKVSEIASLGCLECSCEECKTEEGPKEHESHEHVLEDTDGCSESEEATESND